MIQTEKDARVFVSEIVQKLVPIIDHLKRQDEANAAAYLSDKVRYRPITDRAVEVQEDLMTLMRIYL